MLGRVAWDDQDLRAWWAFDEFPDARAMDRTGRAGLMEFGMLALGEGANQTPATRPEARSAGVPAEATPCACRCHTRVQTPEEDVLRLLREHGAGLDGGQNTGGR